MAYARRRSMQAMRRLDAMIRARSLILIYHRITELQSDPWALAVSPSNFAEHLDVLRRSCHVVPLRELACTRRGRLPRRSVAISFDDGYADNLYNAKPLLERSDLPATAFIPTGAIGSTTEFWWDELDRLLLQPGTLPETLQIRINETAHSWSLGEDRHYTREAATSNRTWKVGAAPPTMRHRLYKVLWEMLRPLDAEKRRGVLNNIRHGMGASDESRASHRTLTKTEVAQIAEGGIIDVGGHTVSHTDLATLARLDQLEEIRTSKRQLEEIVGYPPVGFAYPYGKRANYTKETVELVQQSRFHYACTNTSGAVYTSADPFELPRIYIADQGGEQFASLLSQWFAAVIGQERSPRRHHSASYIHPLGAKLEPG